MNLISLRKKVFSIIIFLFLVAVFNFPEEITIRNIDSIISDIRKEQRLKETDKIDPNKVNTILLEELGDAVMEKMIGDHERHKFMDQMMGGEGSPNLRNMHQRLGYNYLTGNYNIYGDIMGMMYGYPYNNYIYKGGFPMMWNNGYGMMGWGFGGWFMGILFFLVLIIIGLIIYFTLKNIKGTIPNSSINNTPLDILKNRYAKGEITKKEFDEIKKDL